MNNEDYIDLLPLTRTWLEDIVYSFLKRPDGIGEIDGIVLAIKHIGRDVRNNPESNITRAINNYCINSGDLKRSVKYPIFERVDSGTYKLIDYPNTPDLIEIQNIQFAEPGFKRAWKEFVEIAKKHPKWCTLTKREKLVAFARNIPNIQWLRDTIQLFGGSVENFKCVHELKKVA